VRIILVKGVNGITMCLVSFYFEMCLKRAIVVGEGSFRLNVLSRGPPFSLFDMLLVT
jgi:hypothetical protein